jgi:hypothetical protein
MTPRPFRGAVTIGALLALVAVLALGACARSAPARPTVTSATVEITSATTDHVRPLAGGGCDLGAPLHLVVHLVDPAGHQTDGVLASPGRLVDGACVFSTRLPALAGATRVVVGRSAGPASSWTQHAVLRGTGRISLSNDPAGWSPWGLMAAAFTLGPEVSS